MTKQVEAQAVTGGRTGLPGGSDAEDEAPSDGDINKHIGGQGHPRGRKDLPEMCGALCGSPEAHTPPGTGQAGVHTETAPPVRAGL